MNIVTVQDDVASTCREVQFYVGIPWKS